ncbi:hypothetical protein AB0Y04_00265 [Loigolactobacillus coryniformis]|jgi:hypothetical protein|uniref:hypothetical protein n=1 Tax=Loigolactobacillus coryniformis TaxID=1610 RepID=UPI001C60317A|nr:hypothetical protein [Loigolactobacillus coryniformis]MBW4803765.1 hypothetical protein [Loigolactobacillus coryniformis subsp. torquens]MBW4806467.1 hypothetical protein [Loigolactobacillus coryniformis subsp. torquens]
MKERELKLIRQLEDRYGSVLNAPDDDPRLLLLNRELDIEEDVYRYCITDTANKHIRYATNTVDVSQILKVPRSTITMQMRTNGVVKDHYVVTRGEWPEHIVGKWRVGRRLKN